MYSVIENVFFYFIVFYDTITKHSVNIQSVLINTLRINHSILKCTKIFELLQEF